MHGTGRTGVTSYATPTDREVVVTRVVNASRSLVFETFTDPRHIQQWMIGPEGWTMPVCEMDLRPGGAWRYVYRKADGSEMTLTGRCLEIAAPERFVATESWGPEWPESINTLVLTEHAGQTTITMTLTYPSREARDAALKTGMKEGMDQGFARLDEMLKTLV